jgi:hypothetical protein
VTKFDTFNFLKRSEPPTTNTSTQVLVATFVHKYLQSINITGHVKTFVGTDDPNKYIVLITTKADKRSKHSSTIESMIKTNILRICKIEVDVFWKFTIISNATPNKPVEPLGLLYGGLQLKLVTLLWKNSNHTRKGN